MLTFKYRREITAGCGLNQETFKGPSLSIIMDHQ